jgi:hypothetical protein
MLYFKKNKDLELEEVLKNCNTYKPENIKLSYINTNTTIIDFRSQGFDVSIEFNQNNKKSICYIKYKNNYFFSIKENIKIIFEYIYLILQSDQVKNTILF